MIGTITSKLASTLGNPTSYAPLLVKDFANSAGLTYYSYDAGGKIEGKDRFIDEFGTQAIWLGGLPFYNFLADKIIKHGFKMNPNVDLRVVKDSSKEILDWKIAHSPTVQIKNSMQKIADNLPKYKKLTIGKTVFSTVLTLGSYLLLTKYRHAHTQKNLKEEYLKKQKNNEINAETRTENLKSSPFEIFSKKTTSFKGLATTIGKVMYDPVKNLMLVDAGISSERLITSRKSDSPDPTIKNLERTEYFVKEGSFWIFMYFVAKPLGKAINSIIKKMTKIPMELDAKVLSNSLFINSIKDKSILNEISDLNKNTNSLKNELDVLKFLDKADKNQTKSPLVEALKSADILKNEKNTNHINWAKNVEIKQIKIFCDDVKNLSDSVDTKNIDIQKFFQKAQKLKIGGTFANIAFSCLALGIGAPKLIYGIRKKIKGNTESNFSLKLSEPEKNKMAETK